MRRRSPQQEAGEAAAPLPVDKAFVLQLGRETGPALDPFAGRVEHLCTGRRARFETFDDFRAVLGRLLEELTPR